MSENIYFECRKKASKFNDQLKSRAGAAERMGISESSLTHYELGITKNIPVDVVVMMAELYNAPELRNYFCRSECPIGKDLPIAVKHEPVTQAAVHLLNSINKAGIEECAKSILEIAEDGRITDEEADELLPILDAMDRVSHAVSELKIIVEKQKNGERGGE